MYNSLCLQSYRPCLFPSFLRLKCFLPDPSEVASYICNIGSFPQHCTLFPGILWPPKWPFLLLYLYTLWFHSLCYKTVWGIVWSIYHYNTTWYSFRTWKKKTKRPVLCLVIPLPVYWHSLMLSLSLCFCFSELYIIKIMRYLASLDCFLSRSNMHLRFHPYHFLA